MGLLGHFQAIFSLCILKNEVHDQSWVSAEYALWAHNYKVSWLFRIHLRSLYLSCSLSLPLQLHCMCIWVLLEVDNSCRAAQPCPSLHIWIRAAFLPDVQLPNFPQTFLPGCEIFAVRKYSFFFPGETTTIGFINTKTPYILSGEYFF